MSELHECHITFAESVSDKILIAIGQKLQFHYYEIDGDEVMGKGKRRYLTKSMPDGLLLETEMKMLCESLESRGMRWQRRKIEKIILDERQ